ncbi:PREDICTED: uncharacterized protein LOC104596769 [Nelumbo nucifera]|uniref:Uncharacterized protein LOC104596769 n=2 Tax=Nelumbo nucifera TaxID=4432 RepID=A0A1U8A3P2_NELNU|nr:PREDICTED: uncharacterized protein LOC104596769 [Nelumbo nucifera]DAD39247.1 TPA_asm: hypothetical protein HUJ06_013570 [Nelumbo nucifera]
MATDDFSFPTIAEPVPRFMGSPSLWKASSRVLPEPCLGDSGGGGGDREEAEDCTGLKQDEHCRRKSFSSIESVVRRADAGYLSEDDEERMDMLWEDFNDELKRISSMGKTEAKSRLSKFAGSSESDSDAQGEMVEMYCVQAPKMSKTSNAILSSRRSSLLVLMKVFRKMFLLHNHRPKGRTP